MTNQKRPYGKIADGKRNSKKRYVTYRKTNKKKAQIPPEEKESVRIAFLGGINEIGKNMTLYEYGNDMFLVDCGLAFPNSDLPGVDLVIPDFSYVEHNADKIRGIIITHGHEDHIGGLDNVINSFEIGEVYMPETTTNTKTYEDVLNAKDKYSYCTPFTKESLMYRDIFESFFPQQGKWIKDFWMPNKEWENCDVDDPSARVLKNYGNSGK